MMFFFLALYSWWFLNYNFNRFIFDLHFFFIHLNRMKFSSNQCQWNEILKWTNKQMCSSFCWVKRNSLLYFFSEKEIEIQFMFILILLLFVKRIKLNGIKQQQKKRKICMLSFFFFFFFCGTFRCKSNDIYALICRNSIFLLENRHAAHQNRFDVLLFSCLQLDHCVSCCHGNQRNR